MNKIGIVDIEISKTAYKTMSTLPEGIRFYLYLEPYDQVARYAGIHRFIFRHEANIVSGISEFQMNDTREIVKLKNLTNIPFIRIVGLDNLMTTHYDQVMSDINKHLKNTQINFCPENEFGCASALASMWILLGGTDITTSFAHYGNRAATEEVLMTLRIAARYKPNQDLTAFPVIKRLLEEITGIRMAQDKPLLGEEIFHVESGVHVDGILKNPSNYEAYEPKSVGLDTKIVIGKHSGHSSVEKKLRDYGIAEVDSNIIEAILNRVKLESLEKRGSLTDEEFILLAKEVIDNEGETVDNRYDIKRWGATSGDLLS
jgi:homocitrate synthase NifV